MNIFKTLDSDISYKDMVSLDGAFSVAHINYGESPIFNERSSIDMASDSRKKSLSSVDKVEDVLENIDSFSGTEKEFKKNDKIILWENYWLEYINAFDKLITTLPQSVVTIFVGRQAVEIGFKYLILKKTNEIDKTHDLGDLSKLLFSAYTIDDIYGSCMDYVTDFCIQYCQHIEGGNSEYFRYPEYKEDSYFAGNRLDIRWLSYNFALIILKLLHLAKLEDNFEEEASEV